MNNQWQCPVPPEEISKQYNWVAQDEAGYWIAFKDKPKINEEKKCWWLGTQFYQIARCYKNANWRNTLMKIPREQEILNYCCVCGKAATEIHYSMMGSFPFHVCQFHFENTSSAIGYCDKMKCNRMGLVDNNHEWVDLINTDETNLIDDETNK
jgi:hypothetical protein